MCILLAWADDGGSKPELQLSLSCPVELLVDRRVVTIECDVARGRVGEAIKFDLSVGRDGEEDSELALVSYLCS